MNTVLIIDDEKDLCKLVKSNLESTGKYEVVTAYTGDEGVAQARAVFPDLIILDIKMPGKDGFEVCNVLKQDKQTTKIPLVFLTSYEDEETARKAVNLGANGYLVKPFNHESLLYTVESFIRYRR